MQRILVLIVVRQEVDTGLVRHVECSCGFGKQDDTGKGLGVTLRHFVQLVIGLRL